MATLLYSGIGFCAYYTMPRRQWLQRLSLGAIPLTVALVLFAFNLSITLYILVINKGGEIVPEPYITTIALYAQLMTAIGLVLFGIVVAMIVDVAMRARKEEHENEIKRVANNL
jgi:succinate dehydrogenase/fumarate reductase cytochrome b subunit